MKKYWLSGMLLGVSMALLLTGGIALAQSVMVWPDCHQCFPGTVEEFEKEQPGFPYSYMWESCGWTPGEELLYMGWWVDVPMGAFAGYADADENGCISSEGRWGWTCDGELAHQGPEVAADLIEFIFPEDYWGTLDICVGSFCESILFAEVCEEEFVPEPGTIMLLGSGLVGLAGYATLRLRLRP